MSFSMSDTIDGVIKREGGLANDPLDKGGATFEGISQKANPEAWKNGPPTDAQVRAIYEAKYIKWPGFDKITDPQLQVQLIDFGINSGVQIAIQKLQEILGVKVDGQLGPMTLAALTTKDPKSINNQLVIARIKLIGRIVSKNPTQVRFVNSWLDRALQFLV
jgi:lysozyme family protein